MKITPKARRRVLLVLVVLAAIYAFLQLRPEKMTNTGALLETPHYAISTTAGDAQTRLVGDAVESLYSEYMSFFGLTVTPDHKLHLTLYKDQAQFKQHNKAAQWAEAYYLAPQCHAYYAADEANPYHWMMHEATHQLNHEVAHFPANKWINEGLATYFGTSVIDAGKLIPGRIDQHTYPIWVVAKLSLTGDLQQDIGRGKVIGLRALMSGVGGPDINAKFNTYYVGYWSLSHFLFHHEGGKYARAYRQLVAAGGSIDDFEKLIGPVERIEVEWYGYLQQQVANLKRQHAGS